MAEPSPEKEAHDRLVECIRIAINPCVIASAREEFTKPEEMLRKSVGEDRDPRTRRSNKSKLDAWLGRVEAVAEEGTLYVLKLHLREACSQLGMPLRPLPRSALAQLLLFDKARKLLARPRGNPVTTGHPVVMEIIRNHLGYALVADVPTAVATALLQEARTRPDIPKGREPDFMESSKKAVRRAKARARKNTG